MYEQFYGLRERPFDLSTNLKFLLLTPRHEEALSNLEYGLSMANGLTLLIGEPGTGKTTLLRKALAPYMRRPTATERARWVFLNNPALTRQEFFDLLAHGFHLGDEAASSKAALLRELERALVRNRDEGTASILVIDEAQALSFDLLEEVRLLSNIETDAGKLLRVVLAGQPPLATRLNDPGLYQLKQRIGLRCILPPLTLNETATYITHRISLAGGRPKNLFTREAIIAIHQRSGGIPRTINVICDNALLTGFATDQQPVGADIVADVCVDFDLVGPPERPAAPPRWRDDAPRRPPAGDRAPATVASFFRHLQARSR